MRTLNTTLGGMTLGLKANWSAGERISKDVADVMLIVREAGLEAAMAEMGQIYHPRFALTMANIAAIIYIGATENGHTVSLSQIQEAIMLEGLLEAREIAVSFLALIVKPGSQKVVERGEAETGDNAPEK